MDKVSFGSFPRSANHFFHRVLEETLPHCELNIFLHSINSLSVGQNVVTTIRNPFECVPSWAVFTGDVRVNRADRILEWYYAYYQKVNETNLMVFAFEDIISNPLGCVNAITERYSISPTSVKKLELDMSTDFHAPTKDKSMFPKIVEEMHHSDYLNQALSLFNEISDSKCETPVG